MINPSKIRDVQKYVDGRVTVITELTTIGGEVPAALDELPEIVRQLSQLQSAPAEETLRVDPLRILLSRYRAIAANGETGHKADAFESLYRTLKQLVDPA